MTLGASGLRVSRLAFGCEPLGGTDWGKVDLDAVQRAVRRACDQGVTIFDTADVYGLGRSEELLAAALGARRKDVVIATKFGVAWTPAAEGVRARTYRDASPAAVIRCLDASLRRLRIDQIPLYQLHWPDPATPLGHTLDALARSVESGKIRCVGACNLGDADVVAFHEALPLASVQISFNLFDRRSIPTLQTCRANDIGTLAYGCLAQGLLTGKYQVADQFGDDDRRSRLPHFEPEARRRHLGALALVVSQSHDLGRTPAQVALRWALDTSIDVAIVGAKNEQQIDENLGAVGWTLPHATRVALHDMASVSELSS